ncbi:LexA family protein [Pantoea allii]|uniref:LexA family protein n=1 Tax=Pantoea allii TaxID=574096 RepID=UPI003D312A2B
MKQTWQDLAKSRMKEVGMTQERLAEELGVTQGGLGHWLNGRREPSLDVIGEITRILGLHGLRLNPDGSFSKSDENIDISYVKPYEPGKRYPVLSKVQAGMWAEAVEAYTLKDVDLWLESDAHIQGDAFWLEVEGESMTAPAGLSIPEGTFVLFDTGRDPVSGNLVIAKMTDANEATFKKLIVDGNQKYLKGLNPQWPMVPIDGNCRIIGVAVESKLRLI